MHLYKYFKNLNDATDDDDDIEVNINISSNNQIYDNMLRGEIKGDEIKDTFKKF